jgi:allophanate hydrolase subunit 1
LIREVLLKKAVEANLHHDKDFMEQVDKLKKQHTIQNIFYGIKNLDIEHDDHSSRFNAFQDFIDSLRKESDITIDSTVVKTFILDKRNHI